MNNEAKYCRLCGILPPYIWRPNWHWEVIGKTRDCRIPPTQPVSFGEFMATVIGEEIDVLAKAKRALGGDYTPSENDEYMSESQLDYYRRLLLEWKKLILSAAQDTLQQLQDGPIREPDLNDRASSETDWGIELRTRDRQRKLIAKIDSALRRIEEGEYGYCEVSGEPIGLGRLSARPIATMTVEAQEAHERREKISRDD